MAATTTEDAKKDTTNCKEWKNDIYVEIDQLLANKNRFQSIKERKEESVRYGNIQENIQRYSSKSK